MTSAGEEPVVRVVAACLLVVSGAVASHAPQVPGKLVTSPEQIHDRAIVIDTHADTTQRLIHEKAFDIGERYESGNVDIPRMKEGGLDALFFSIWVPVGTPGPSAVERAFQQIGAVRDAVRLHPRDLVLATTAADIRAAAASHRIAALIGLEGGHLIDDDLRLLRNYAALGVRYLTLTHVSNTKWADSSGDKPAHNGLTAFGRDVVHELNRLGVLVDISHVSDKTFYDALDTSAAPVIASHSSCRALSAHPRNMTDDMLRALGSKGGVIMINYEVSFLSEEYRAASERKGSPVAAMSSRIAAICHDDGACSTKEEARIVREAMSSGRLPNVSWERIIDHIDHAVKVAGIDHVGLGSDFDGATMPFGLDDASQLPKITRALLDKGYGERGVEKVLGGNFLRVMEQAERVAADLSLRGQAPNHR